MIILGLPDVPDELCGFRRRAAADRQENQEFQKVVAEQRTTQDLLKKVVIARSFTGFFFFQHLKSSLVIVAESEPEIEYKSGDVAIRILPPPKAQEIE